jgi:GH15 family glucan-1,4-alpha-glucosidase
LPLPSWDIWEERRGVLTFTSAAVWAGLDAAARFANAFGDTGLALRFGRGADEIRDAILQHLWDAELGRFLRMIVLPEGGSREIVKDAGVDASFFGLHFLRFLPPDDPRLISTLDSVVHELAVDAPQGGLARYRGDGYYAQSQDWERVPGNPWFISQCWYARWRIARAESPEELEKALHTLDWVAQRSTSAGLMPEQIHPVTGEPLAVTPLIWSHASFVSAVHDYLDRRETFGGCPTCGRARVHDEGLDMEHSLR